MPALFVEQLTVIDCSYLDSYSMLLGASWIVDVELFGVLNEHGMLFDFALAKKVIKEVIDTTVDHRLLIPGASELLKHTIDHDGVKVEYEAPATGNLVMHSPSCAVASIPCSDINIAAVEEFLQQVIIEHLPDNIESISIKLREEEISGASYRYSHGLKLHDGNCQRIAHGHRSAIKIIKNGQRDIALELEWANKFDSAYLAYKDDIVGANTIDGIDYITFAYNSSQGNFELTVPKKICHCIETETTVENIAAFIFKSLVENESEAEYCVYAFEGVGKGAYVNELL